jgi:hypothetical protein
MGFTDAPYELAFSGANGEIDISDDTNWIGFGGDMEPEGISECTRNQLVCLWGEISKKKIKEAYTEYLEQREKICAMPNTSQGGIWPNGTKNDIRKK